MCSEREMFSKHYMGLASKHTAVTFGLEQTAKNKSIPSDDGSITKKKDTKEKQLHHKMCVYICIYIIYINLT